MRTTALTHHSNLNIVVALSCEARLFIDFLKLKKYQCDTNFQLFCNQQENIFLIVSGVGNIKAAAACSFIHTISRANSKTSYLNVGIAGSQQFAMGEAWLIHKIIYHATQKAWYPQCVPTTLGLRSCVLQSFDTPQEKYHHQYIQDMEAYGFVSSASMHVAHEQIQILKIISDNASIPHHQITPHQVTELMSNQREVILKLIHYLLELSTYENSLSTGDEILNAFLTHIHFTQYQRHQLKELLRRFSIHMSAEDPLALLTKFSTSHEVLSYLTQCLNQTEYFHS